MTFSLQWRRMKTKPVYLRLGRVRDGKRSRWQCSLSYLRYFLFLHPGKVKSFRQSKEVASFCHTHSICPRTNSMEHYSYHYPEHSILAIRYKEYLPVQEQWVHATPIVSDFAKIQFSAGWNWESKTKRAFASYFFSHSCWSLLIKHCFRVKMLERPHFLFETTVLHSLRYFMKFDN